MTYLVEIEETPNSKALIEHLKTLKYVKLKSTKKASVKEYSFTEEDMALPGANISKVDLEAWLKLPDNDKGATGEQARERLKKKLAKSLTK
jgi:hypothetical protein